MCGTSISTPSLRRLRSQLAITYVPAGVVESLQPYYTILLTSAVIVGGQQLWYAKVEKPKA